MTKITVRTHDFYIALLSLELLLKKHSLAPGQTAGPRSIVQFLNPGSYIPGYIITD